jgi:glycosyltransferase involved in cell wall biosynthesis
MRITILTVCFPPDIISGAKLIYDLATEMSRQGNQVTVVTLDHTLRTALEVSKEENVTVVRVRTGKIRHASRIMRAVTEIRLSGTIWNAARCFFETHPCDLVVCYTPTIFWSGLVEKLKTINGCGSYLVLRDIFPQWAVDAGLLSKYGLAYWYFRRQELRLYRTVDVIGVESAGNLEYFSSPPLRGRYVAEILLNWTKVEERPHARSGLRVKWGLQDKVIFMYGGNFGVAQDMDNILRLAANLKNERSIVFLLVGEGSESERIRQEIERQGMGNILLHPAVSQKEYMEILEDCDVGLITLRRNLKTYNLPGKMLGYLELKKPILASVNPGNDLSAIIRDYNIGLACINGEDAVFRQHALQLAYDRDLRRSMGMNAHTLLEEKFNVSGAARQIVAHFPLRKVSISESAAAEQRK